MKIKPQNLTGHIPPGRYNGTIIEQRESSDQRYLWLKIDVEERDVILNIAIPCASVIFNDFAKAFVDKQGYVNTEDFVDTMIEFSLKNYELNDSIYSRFTALNAIMEDDENDWFISI